MPHPIAKQESAEFRRFRRKFQTVVLFQAFLPIFALYFAVDFFRAGAIAPSVTFAALGLLFAYSAVRTLVYSLTYLTSLDLFYRNDYAQLERKYRIAARVSRFLGGERSSEYSASLGTQAMLCAELGLLEQAKELSERALTATQQVFTGAQKHNRAALGPTVALAYGHSALVDLLAGDLDKCIGHASGSIETHEGAGSQTGYLRWCAYPYLARAAAEAELGQTSAAVGDLERGIELSESSIVPGNMGPRARQHIRTFGYTVGALVQNKAGDYNQCEAYINKLRSDWESDPLSIDNLSKMLLQRIPQTNLSEFNCKLLGDISGEFAAKPAITKSPDETAMSP